MCSCCCHLRRPTTAAVLASNDRKSFFLTLPPDEFLSHIHDVTPRRLSTGTRYLMRNRYSVSGMISYFGKSAFCINFNIKYPEFLIFLHMSQLGLLRSFSQC